MAVDWSAHRFSGGVLALDVANTVVHRAHPERRFDRFAEAGEIARFAEAAQQLRPAEFDGRLLRVADPAAIGGRVKALRETTDALFREASGSGALDASLLEPHLRAVADCLAGHSERFGGVAAATIAFEAALGFSALTLLQPPFWRRVRICPACAWLFLDASRNGSRRWCDMAVCGNRAKAQLHYRKSRQRGASENA